MRGTPELAILRVWLAVTMASVVLLFSFAGSSSARAASAQGVAWKVLLVAQPTNFTITSDAAVDRYVVALTNIGDRPSSGLVTVSDSLPTGIIFAGYEGSGWSCAQRGAPGVVTCTYSGIVKPLEVTAALNIQVTAATAGITVDPIVVTGGGAPSETAGISTDVSAPPPPFEILHFDSDVSDGSGTIDRQAGARPLAMTVAFDFPQVELSGGRPFSPLRLPKDLRIALPSGLTGSVLAAPQCRIIEVVSQTCPARSRIGTLLVNFNESGLVAGAGAIPVYNVVPEHGYPAEFGAFVPQVQKPAFLYVTARARSDYGLDVTAPDIPAAGELTNAVASIFGDPGEMDQVGPSPQALLTNQSACAPFTTTIAVESWEGPNRLAPPAETPAGSITGCDLLQFRPTFALTPEGGSATAGEPSGYAAELQVPQSQSGVEGLAAPDVKSVTVQLPPGLSLNPSAADGLVACPAEGPEGINIAGPLSGEPGPNGGVEEERAVPGHCPLASQVGTLEATTPALAQPLQGHVYVATPGCGGTGQAACSAQDALDGNLFGLYLELEGSGVVIKLRGDVSADPATGLLTASFQQLPQQPVSDLKLTLKGGPRAPLANPETCGEAETFSDITPWSTPETPDAHPNTAFAVTGCEGLPFAPAFSAGTTNTAGGAYTELGTTITRTDRMQDLGAVQVQTPPGLLGMLSHITVCQEPLAAQTACPASAQIGTVTAGAGAGSHPYWVTGKVYATGPYKGAPFGLEFELPAQAGPFNLGTVVTRAALNVNPVTAALTVTSDPLPQIIDGVPLRIQTVNVAVNHSQFIFNPTNCAAQQITGTIASAQGTQARVSTPFAAGDCRNLPFDPGFTATTRRPAGKADGAELDVKVTSGPGQANIHSVAVALPKQLPSRLKTIQQACLDTTFDANPAACPPISLIGIARAITPVLSTPVTGPAYLVSHGGAAFPDLDIVLQGENTRLDLTGSINISKGGVTSSTFANIPDAPVSSFELQLPEGPRSALATNGSLCAKPLTMPTTIVGQNGRRLMRTTKIKVMGCPKSKTRREPAASRRVSTRRAGISSSKSSGSRKVI
jgi:hypothetical protein